MVTAANGYFMNEIQNKIESLGYYMTCSILNSKIMVYHKVEKSIHSSI